MDLRLRRATLDDFEFMVRVDLEDEGVTPTYQKGWGEKEFGAHRELVKGFITDSDKGALLADFEGESSIGLVMWRLRDLNSESAFSHEIVQQIKEALPSSGLFCEIFQLWVDPRFRRRRIGTTLKLAVEEDARARGVEMIYTHTEERNVHVIALNERLGYREVRRGPIWDNEIRVSLVKNLRAPSSL